MQDRPWFLWDLPVTEQEFRERLRCENAEIRAQWQGRLLREARFNEVWQYVSLEDVLRDWIRIRRHLGRSRPFWEFLIEGWKSRGLIPGH